ncbi:MAG: radical SAM protein [Bacteroidales bacterium]|nr:radical SAM protein [Bacteroidales bacterium]
MASHISQLCYLAQWFVRAKFFGRRAPMQSVLFISDRCNLSCKHCSVYNHTNPITKTYEQIRQELLYCYSLGSRFVDFEGGEPFLWRDGDKTVDDLCDLAHQLGFFSCTITTNAQKPFPNSHADSIWVSLDGVGQYHERVRGEGTFARLEQNIASANHRALSVSMSVNTLNQECLTQVLDYVKNSPYISQIAFNFHTQFPGSEYLTLPQADRERVIDTIISYKRKGYPVMNTCAGLRKMKQLNFKKRCWMTNYVLTDGSKHSIPVCGEADGCQHCGFSMAGEMASLFQFHPEVIFAGLKLRV